MTEWNYSLDEAPFNEELLVACCGILPEPYTTRGYRDSDGQWLGLASPNDSKPIYPYAWGRYPSPPLVRSI